jgi:hypothetical protein
VAVGADVTADSTRSRFAAPTARIDSRPNKSFGTPSLLALLLLGGCHNIEMTDALFSDALLFGALSGLVNIH